MGCLRWRGDDAPSVRKPFSSDPRGCLGVPDPPAAAPPLEARSVAAFCVRALGPLSRAPTLRGRATTQLVALAPTVARASPLRVGGGFRRAGGRRPSRRSAALRAGVLPRARSGACAWGFGWGRGGLSRPPTACPAPTPRASGSPSAPVSRVSQAAGSAVRGHGSGPVSSSGWRSARDASPPPRPGRTGRVNGWCVDGWRKPRRLPCGCRRVACGLPRLAGPGPRGGRRL